MKPSTLYKMVYTSCVEFAVYQRKTILENVKKFLPHLHSFANDFLLENSYGIEESDYQTLQLLLLDILKDLEQGLTYQDTVLLEDTVEYGLLKFLELFFTTEQEITRMKEECVIE